MGGYIKHDPKYFAMLNNAVAIEATPLEGGNRTAAFDYYQYLLSREFPDCPIGFQLPADQEAAIQNGMTGLIEINNLIQKLFATPPADLDDAISKVVTYIQQNTTESESCYLPSGWVGDPHGHYASLKCRKLKNGQYAFSMLNLGGGVRYHQRAMKSGSKDLRVYQSEEYAVDLTSKNGRELLRRLIEIQFRDNQIRSYDANLNAVPNINPYSEADLYGLLMLYGREIPLSDKLDQKVATPQRGGSCTVTNTSLVPRDILVNHGADLKARKRYYFVIKLRSIIDSFEAYLKGDVPRNVLEWGLNEFSVRVNKVYQNCLSSEEVIYCEKLQKQIQDKLDEDKQAIITEKSAVQQWPDSKGDAPSNQNVVIEKKQKETYGNEYRFRRSSETEIPTITLENILKIFDLKDTKWDRKELPEIYHLFMSLPHCTGKENDPFWGKIPAEEVNQFINNLAGIIAEIERRFEDYSDLEKQRIMAINLIAYDIMAQIMPNPQYAMGLDDTFTDQHSYDDTEIYFCVKRIRENFEARSKGKQRVLTNCVTAQGSESDQTVYYTMNIMITQSQRLQLMKMLGLEKCTDYELFKKLFGEFHSTEFQNELDKILGTDFLNTMRIAAAAHGSSGWYLRESEKKYYRFSESKFYRDLERKKALTDVFSPAGKHIPQFGSESQSGRYQDFSENTLYHPKDDLMDLRGKEKQRIIDSQYPYQVKVSGSINPDSEPWKVDKKHKHLFEELDEQFRHIECSPHLQVVRTLAWLTKNPDKLRYPQVRQRLNSLVFSYGKLDDAIASDHELTLNRMSDCFAALIKYCKEESVQDTQILSWIGQFSFSLRSYAEAAGKIYGLSMGRFVLPSFKELFLECIKNNSNAKKRAVIAIELVRSFRGQSPLLVADCAVLLLSRIIMKLGASTVVATEAWNELSAEVQDAAARHPKQFFDNLKPLLVQYLKVDPTTEWKISGMELINQNNDFYIDLKEGTLQRRNGKELTECTQQVIDDNQALCKRLGISIDNTQIYKEDYQARSSDGQWIFNISSDSDKLKITQISKRITIEGMAETFRLIEDNRYISGEKLPFESEKYFNRHYQYWRSAEDEKCYFVRQENSELAYWYNQNSGLILQLKENAKGDWQRTGKILLNLTTPNTELEKNWAQRLGPLFGVNNIRCTAQLSNDTKRCTVERIEHFVLGLNFRLDEHNHLVWEDDPDYYLADEKGLAILNGLPSVIQLKTQSGELRILIPAFALCEGDKNNAFNETNIIDYTKLCHENHRYFEYTLNDQNELVGKTVEANLYLAMLYRSLGEYKKALYYLDQCKTHEKLSEASLAIAMQALTHKIKTPLGAAFDLKLDVYIQEHSKKWSRDMRPIHPPKDWDEWVRDKQLPFYHQTVSQYKSGVSILPAYARLNTDEIGTVSGALIKKEDEINQVQMPIQDERVGKVGHLRGNLWDSPNSESWKSYAYTISATFDMRFPSTVYQSDTWRTYDKRSEFGPGFAYLYYFFGDLLKEAISKDADRLDALYKRLYSLLMNDKRPLDFIYPLIAMLIFASKHPDFFTEFKFEPLVLVKDDYDFDAFKRNKEIRARLILNVGNIFLSKREELEDKEYYLVPPKNPRISTKPPQTLPADFVPAVVHFAIAPIREEHACKHPLESIASKYFTQENRPITQNAFALEAAGLKNASPLEARLCEQYQRGHEANKSKTKRVYHVKDKLTLDEIKKDLKGIKNKDITRQKELKEAITAKANRLPGDNEALAANLMLSRASEQHEVITLSDIFNAFLQQDPNLLTAKNPHLTQDNIAELFSMLSDYALITSRLAQVNSALDEVAEKKSFNEMEPYEVQLFANIIDKSRAYNVSEYPEFLVYEYATKKILREDQVDTLIKIITLMEAQSSDPDEMHHALLQFAAGGGKTSVLIPILAHRFARKGFLPVIFNTNELYETALDDIPKNLRASFRQNMEVIERELEHKWSIPELAKLLSDLERWRKEKRCLLMKPVTWHSLNIARKLAYFKGDLTLAKAAEDVLDFFKSKSIKLEDECHIISDALQQSIKTYDNPLKPPKDQLALMLRFYDYLMGYEVNSDEIQRLAGIKSNQKQPISPENLVLLQTKLASKIADEPGFSACDRQLLVNYLLQPERTRPGWLLELHENDPETADRVILARAFIKTHLPHILSMQANKDYGVSMHFGDLTAAPKHEGKDVPSHFGDHNLVVALTIQMFEQQGLTAEQVNQLLDQLLQDHKDEREWNHNLSLRTEAELWLSDFNSLGYNIKTYKDITPSLRERLCADPRFFKHPIVIKKYLTQFALPQVGVPPERQSSTAAELQSGFTRSLLLSATPGLPELYPAVLPRENCFLEEAFEAQVLDTLLSPENSKHALLSPTQTPTQFFEALPPGVLSTITTMIDRGALLTDFNGQDVIASYLGLKEERVRPTTTGVFFSKNKTHLKFKAKDVIDIPGTDLVETLKKHKIKPEQFLLFLFMDLSKTTGVDIKRPFRDVAGLTVGKEQTVTETIQAAMRERQLLDENAQTVTWIMFQSLYREINPQVTDNTFNLRDVFYWMIRNEAKQFTSKLINRAYQGIENEIQALVWQMWRDNPGTFPKDYQEKLKQKTSLSPWYIYEQESVEINSKQVLSDFRDKLFSQFGFKPDDPSIPKQTLNRINKLIEETSLLIEKLHTPPKIQIDNKVEQEMKLESAQKEEQELENTMRRNIDGATQFRFAAEAFDSFTLESIFSENIKPIVLPGCEAIGSPKLFFLQEHFRPLEPLNQKEASKFDQLKPIEMLLVKIMPDGTKQYRACTAAEGEYYSLVLNHYSLVKTDPAYVIMTADGTVVSTSNNTTSRECEKWIKQDETQKMLAYANFLSGRVNDPVLMSRVIKDFGWSQSDYETLAKTLAPMLVSNCAPNLLDNHALYNLCGWGKQPAQALSFEAQEAPYQPPTEILHTNVVMKKDPGTFNLPVRQPERALSDYIFPASANFTLQQTQQSSRTLKKY